MRRILVLTHTGRTEAVQIALDACSRLRDAGLVPVMRSDEAAQIRADENNDFLDVEILGKDVGLDGIELGMVLGGDGTILRTAELVRGSGVPLLGVNLGHVGFLAESEKADLQATVQAIVERSYTVEERMTIDVQVWHGGARRARPSPRACVAARCPAQPASRRAGTFSASQGRCRARRDVAGGHPRYRRARLGASYCLRCPVGYGSNPVGQAGQSLQSRPTPCNRRRAGHFGGGGDLAQSHLA